MRNGCNVFHLCQLQWMPCTWDNGSTSPGLPKALLDPTCTVTSAACIDCDYALHSAVTSERKLSIRTLVVTLMLISSFLVTSLADEVAFWGDRILFLVTKTIVSFILSTFGFCVWCWRWNLKKQLPRDLLLLWHDGGIHNRHDEPAAALLLLSLLDLLLMTQGWHCFCKALPPCLLPGDVVQGWQQQLRNAHYQAVTYHAKHACLEQVDGLNQAAV